MASTFFHKIQTDWRYRVACVLVPVAVAVVASLVTGKLGAGALVMGVFSIVIGGAKYRHEQSAPDL